MGSHSYGIHCRLASIDKGWDSIYVVVDRMTKHSHFIPTKTRYSASQVVAWQFIKYVFKHHGFPKEIINDERRKIYGSLLAGAFLSSGYFPHT